jgi:adenosylcobyric acid synthase
MTKQAIMVVGTTSHAGKSFLCTAICRILARRGYSVTPFKGQNMALNAYVTQEGGEIGFAQAVQAWAAKVPPTVQMNPILLKPQGDMTSQVILNGQAVGRTMAADYYKDYFERGWEAIKTALAQLQSKFEVIVCEGAGSPAEINLKHRDLTNMRVAKHLQANTILVVDIDRGGSFAHVVGTLQLLEPDERELIKGIVINKFRGQRSLLESGITWLEDYTGIPVIGVLPYVESLFPAEDSLDLLDRRSRKPDSEITIAVIRLQRISNFTDFDPLDAEPSVTVKYVLPHQRLGNPDAVILPGTKTTVADLKLLHESGMVQQLQDYHRQGGTIFGICGGLQILGQEVVDSQGIEGEAGTYPGLNLLPIQTVIDAKKVTRQRIVDSVYPVVATPVTGYEIHQGRTEVKETETIKALFTDASLGFVNEAQSVWGCYLHGIFDNGEWRRKWLNQLREKQGLTALPTQISNYSEQRDQAFDILADFVEEYLDLSSIVEE